MSRLGRLVRRVVTDRCDATETVDGKVRSCEFSAGHPGQHLARVTYRSGEWRHVRWGGA